MTYPLTLTVYGSSSTCTRLMNWSVKQLPHNEFSMVHQSASFSDQADGEHYWHFEIDVRDSEERMLFIISQLGQIWADPHEPHLFHDWDIEGALARVDA
ncbi:hypothetical protein [Sphingomonas sp. CFBP 13706]|uniref:hypothetical protein n=1 Tax=Sphingomonas sp. CFBP 13706 TaxID=2775314 RepID=UPI0017840D03|nr:hypothetical protein [Sphingomonas sp. CFBP 13706]MBD8734910.1 hypothetical protein [Sphingomonas sp. CFBP 13706]